MLLVWQAVLAASRPARTELSWELATPRAQHYVQSFCQFSVYAYWGWYWPPVYAYFPLLFGQLLFAYAFDMLLAWSRRERYALGFGPFPIVFSTNLFLWFKDEWFAWQFALIALGFLGKAFVRWERDGRRVHIFNPSAFTLAIFSLGLLVTGTTHLTWAQEINSTFALGPRIYTVLFLIGLVVMYFFAITPVTAARRGDALCRQRPLHRWRRACRISSTPRSPRRCFSACTCWSPIPRRHRARRWAG